MNEFRSMETTWKSTEVTAFLFGLISPYGTQMLLEKFVLLQAFQASDLAVDHFLLFSNDGGPENHSSTVSNQKAVMYMIG